MNVALRVQSPPTVQRRGLPTQTPVVLGRQPELRLPRSMLWTHRVPAVFLLMPFQVPCVLRISMFRHPCGKRDNL